MVRVYVVDLGRFLDCFIFYCVFFYNRHACFDFMQRYFFSSFLLLFSLLWSCVSVYLFCLYLLRFSAFVANKDIYKNITRNTNVGQVNIVHAFFSIARISLRLSVLRQSVVLFIPSTDERSALVVFLTAFETQSLHRGVNSMLYSVEFYNSKKCN